MTQFKIQPALVALLAAFLFGASTPAEKLLIGQIAPQLLAGVLYLGSGVGLFLLRLLTNRHNSVSHESKLKGRDIPSLSGAILFGGVFGPLLLITGLTTSQGGTASLLLNLEAVFTAILAWFVFKENFDKRLLTGMLAIVCGGLSLVWTPSMVGHLSLGLLAVVAACLCWAIDNNLTRNISDADPMQIAAIKGLVAGLINCLVAIKSGAVLSINLALLTASIVGFLGYGVSLVLYIKSLRLLGTARTGAYFSTAPFVGTLLCVLFLHEPITVNLVVASAFMILGVWLHVTETHEHIHTHSEDEHEHLHWHDEHHRHDHVPGISLVEPHSHWHRHDAIKHSHPHFPDTHHRHAH